MLSSRECHAVIFPELLKLKIPWPDDLSEMRSKLFETRGGHVRCHTRCGARSHGPSSH
jgi:hypothetical protein